MSECVLKEDTIARGIDMHSNCTRAWLIHLPRIQCLCCHREGARRHLGELEVGAIVAARVLAGRRASRTKAPATLYCTHMI